MTILAAFKKWRMYKLLPPSLAILMMFLISDTVFSQQGKELLIEANETHNVNLFFPDPIAKFMLGSTNFKFAFDPNSPIGSIQSKKGKDSNLTVITTDGSIYSFLLRYHGDISNFNIFVKKENSIGSMKSTTSNPPAVSSKPTTNTPPPSEPIQQHTQVIPAPDTELASPTIPAPKAPETTTPALPAVVTPQPDTETPIEVSTTSPEANDPIIEDPDSIDPDDMFLPGGDDGMVAEQDDLYFKDREEYYRIFCENNFMQPSYIKRTFTTSKSVILRLNNILGDRNELYFILQIENGSKNTYETDFLNFFTQKKSPKDQVLMEPVFKYNLQEKIEPQGINEVVYVFKKFKIDAKEKVVVVLDEKEGRRTLVLSIFDKQINTIKI